MTASTVPPENLNTDAAARQLLSSLADGDAAGLEARGGVSAALAAWRLNPDARQAWHTHHLIGDVMRSDDLAHTATQDMAFISRLRDKLDAEPAYRSPVPEEAAKSAAKSAAPTLSRPHAHAHARRLRPPVPALALAASVAVAAVALWVNRPWVPASADGAPLLARTGATGATGAAAPALAVNGAGVLRDPRLDEFLRLHQMARGGLPVSAPGGSLQRADLQMPAGADR